MSVPEVEPFTPNGHQRGVCAHTNVVRIVGLFALILFFKFQNRFLFHSGVLFLLLSYWNIQTLDSMV